MKKRIAIAVGGLGILTSVWILSWSRYQDDISSPSVKEEEEKKSEKITPRRYRSKRVPATKIKVNKAFKKIHFESPLVMKDLKPKAKAGVIIHPTENITSGNFTYGVASNIKVVPISEGHLFDDSQIVDKKFGKLFVKEQREKGDALILHNSKTRQLAIMTGVFKIKLHDFDNWSSLQSEYNLILEGNFPGIRLSLLKTEDTSKAPMLLEQLKEDPRIERVELEILENPPVIK
ncbi:MAG: hypothetical protein ACJAT2_000456 [Bacteriovoracaceae bacterium]|jgi:hypothetical protein